MVRKTDILKVQIQEAGPERLKDSSRAKQNRIRSLIANVTIPVALLLVLIATSAQADPHGAKAKNASNLRTFHGRLIVVGVTPSYGHIGLRAGDQIVAVNGRRVSTEAAFMNRLTMPRSGTQATSIMVARNGTVQLLNVPTLLGGGIINPNLMVMTSQGVMHKDTAARLGLVGTPITGSPEGPLRP